MDKLRAAVKDKDNEAAHGIYDKLLKAIAMKADPKAVAELDALVDNIEFWYA
jgi:hypothetical protein